MAAAAVIGPVWMGAVANLISLVPALFCFGAGAGMLLARLAEVTLSTVKTGRLS